MTFSLRPVDVERLEALQREYQKQFRGRVTKTDLVRAGLLGLEGVDWEAVADLVGEVVDGE